MAQSQDISPETSEGSSPLWGTTFDHQGLVERLCLLEPPNCLDVSSLFRNGAVT